MVATICLNINLIPNASSGGSVIIKTRDDLMTRIVNAYNYTKISKSLKLANDFYLQQA